MAWGVEFTDEFRDWWNVLTEGQQDDLAHSVRHLMEFGPALGFPHSSKVGSSRYPQMRELRTQSAGKPLRTLYAFNPLRSAILLVGGEKTGDDRWYEKFVPIADRLFERHLLDLKKEGLVVFVNCWKRCRPTGSGGSRNGSRRVWRPCRSINCERRRR